MWQVHKINMSVIAQENFNSYTIGASLNNGAGGSGWSANWTATDTLVQGAVSGNTNQVAALAATTSNISRTFTAPASNKIVCDFFVNRTVSNSLVYAGVIAGGSQYCFVFDASNVAFAEYRYNGTTTGDTYTNPFPSLNTWYEANISIDKTTTTNNIVFSVNGTPTATFSSTISSLSSPQFFESISGYIAGVDLTQIQISDGGATSNTGSGFFNFM